MQRQRIKLNTLAPWNIEIRGGGKSRKNKVKEYKS